MKRSEDRRHIRTPKSVACRLDGRLRAAAIRSDQARAFSLRRSTRRLPRIVPRSTRSPLDPSAPSFDNTIVALEKSGRALDRVANVFFVLTGADTSDEIEAIEREISPLLARHNNALYLNRALYARIAVLYQRRDALGLNAEQARVLDRYHTRFVRAGAARRATGAGSPGGDQRAAREPRHAVRPERAGGREGLRAGAGGGRSCRLAGFRPRCRAGRRRGTRPAPANTPSRWRAPPSRPSCSSRPAATCAKRRSRPGSRAAKMAARPTTAR